MSRSASKADLIETIKSTITTDWNKQSEQGLPTDLRAYNVAALVRDLDIAGDRRYGYTANALYEPGFDFADLLRKHLRKGA
jgi:hypothetical protein